MILMRLVAFLWVLCGFSISYAQVSLEPSGSQPMVNCSFNTNTCSGQVNQGTFKDWGQVIYGNPAPIVSLAQSNMVSPPNVMDSFLPSGQTSGGAWLAWYNSVKSRELYMRGRLMLNATFSNNVVGVTKLFFIRNYENSQGAPITNGVFTIRGSGADKVMEFSANTSGLNNAPWCGGDSIGNTCFPNVGAGIMTRGQMVDVQVCVSASTTTTSHDGVVWWAINGVMQGKYTTMNYGGLATTEWVANNTWDGNLNGQGYTSDTHVYWDDLYLSTPPSGGCLAIANGSSGGGGGDTTPPGRATGLVVTQLN